MTRVAVLGAGGFIGGRTVEMLHLLELAEVRPIVRNASRLAGSSRFALDGRVADAFDVPGLAAAFAHCDVVVHAISGTPGMVAGAVEPAYAAAERAGVRRLVYLSSASVHGQRPVPGTTEDTPLELRQPLPYNSAKARAEQTLARLRARGRVEVVVLRPGIVLGPRSFWVTSFADALLAGQAYLVNDGRGICNSIYIDNLVHALYLAMTVDGIDGEAFLVGDEEHVTWLDVYRPITDALGFDLSVVPRLPPVSEPAVLDRLRAFRGERLPRVVRSLVPARFRRRAIVRRLMAGLHPGTPAPPSPWAAPSPAPSGPTLEMSLLHGCDYKLPHAKAAKLLRYQPTVSFAEGCRRTVAWLAFAGYPVSTGLESAGRA